MTAAALVTTVAKRSLVQTRSGAGCYSGEGAGGGGGPFCCRATVLFLFSSLSWHVATSSHRLIPVLPPPPPPPPPFIHPANAATLDMFVLSETVSPIYGWLRHHRLGKPPGTHTQSHCPVMQMDPSWPKLGIQGNSCLLCQIKPSAWH